MGFRSKFKTMKILNDNLNPLKKNKRFSPELKCSPLHPYSYTKRATFTYTSLLKAPKRNRL